MITPDYLDEIIKETESVVAKQNEIIIKRIAKRIADSFKANEENILIPATINDLHKLMDTGMVYDDIQDAITKALPQIESEVRKAFLKSASEINDYNNLFAKELIETLNEKGKTIEVEIQDFKSVGLPTSASQLHMTAKEIRVLENIYKRTMNTIKNYTRTIPSAGQQIYIDACNDAYLRIQSGESPNQAICDTILDMAEKGVQIVNYASGRTDSIETAIARAVRTGVNKANSEIVLTRCAEMGIGYVKVSSHLGARVTKKEDFTNHAWWQGKVYKLDYNNPMLQKYKPTQEDVEQNKKDGFGWIDEIRGGIK